MRNQGKNTGLAFISAGVLCFAAGNGWADGYRNPPPTAAGIGKSGAHRVFADDASAISYNPANLALQTNASLVVGTAIARTETHYSPPIGGNAESDGDWNYLPSVYFSAPVGDGGLAFGLGITTPYGQGIEWDAASLYNPFAPISLYQAEIMMLDFSPTVAFRLGDRISVGAGLDIYYSELEFDGLVATVPPPGPPSGNAKAEGDDIAFGGNAALTWQMTDRQRAIFTYRSETELDYEGDLTVTPGAPLVSSTFGLKVKYPTILATGYGIELTDNVRIEANLEWLNWSVNKTQTADLGANGSLSIPQNWDDTFTVGVGGSWRCCKNWTLRAGYAFIESPIPDATITPLLPDADRHALSVGLGYALGRHAVDAAYTYSIYDDRTGTPSGDYDIDSDLLGLTYSLSF